MKSAVSEHDLGRLSDAARGAREHAHAPYSRYRVGAALLDEHGRVHSGCNVENAAYPEGLCAEAVALGALVTAGGTRVRAVLVAGSGAETVTPCGGCRQKLSEFAAADTPMLAVDEAGSIRARHTLGELLPFGFGPGHVRTP